MNEFWAALVGAVVGGLISLVGVWLTNKYSERITREQLERSERTALDHLWWQKKYDAYAVAIEQTREIVDCSHDLGEHHSGASRLVEARVAELNQRIVAATDRLRNLYSLSSFLMTLRSSEDLLGFVVTVVTSEGPQADDLDQIVDRGNVCLNVLVDEAVTELRGSDNRPEFIRKWAHRRRPSA